MVRALIERIRASSAAKAGLVGLCYLAATEAGHFLSFRSQDQVLVTLWPPAGLLLAVLVLTRYRSWPAMLLAASTARLISDVMVHDLPVWVSLGFAAANFAEASLGAWLLRRFEGTPITLTRIREVLGFACFSAVFSAAIGAALGAAIVHFSSGVAYAIAFKMWWVGDIASVLVVASVILAWSGLLVAFPANARHWRIVEGTALFIGVVAVTEGVYGELLPQPLTIPIYILPFMLWAGLRFGPAGGATAVLLVAMIGSWNVSEGRGPFTYQSADPSQQVLRAQAAMCVLSVAVLVLAAIVAERKHVEDQRTKLIGELEQALAEIKTLRGLIPLCSWCKKIRNDQGFWQRLEVYLLDHTQAEITHGLCPECMARQLATMDRSESDEDLQ